jgi:hypothetical protein
LLRAKVLIENHFVRPNPMQDQKAIFLEWKEKPKNKGYIKYGCMSLSFQTNSPLIPLSNVISV